MFLDLGLGILGAIIFAQVIQIKVSFLVLSISIIFALLPDLDFVFGWIKHTEFKNVSHEHRDLLHYPLLLIPLGSIMIFLFNSNYAYLFAVLVLLHFVHDSIGIGWGVLWLYPFSKKYYKFFSEKNGSFSKRLVVSWTHKEQHEASIQFGDKDWFKNIYLKLHPISMIEFLFFIFALILLWQLR